MGGLGAPGARRGGVAGRGAADGRRGGAMDRGRARLGDLRDGKIWRRSGWQGIRAEWRLDLAEEVELTARAGDNGCVGSVSGGRD